MSWWQRRKRAFGGAAKMVAVDEKLAAVDRQLIDQAARLVRLEAEIAPYVALHKKRPE